MKKVLLLIVFLFFIVPASVQASGVYDLRSIVSSVKVFPSRDSSTLLHSARNDKKKDANKYQKKLPCEYGYRFNYRELKCEKVVVPEHGILNEDGISVRCEVGYRLDYEKNICNKVIIPAHAQLSGTGDDFQCDRDFRRVDNHCEELKLPANSHIAAGGNDFDCNTGFTKQGSLASGDAKCVDAKKPSNAKFFPNSDDWYCENSYVRIDDGCEPLKVPTNARASDTGTFFYCLPGHRLAENGRDCEQIRVPENAEPNWLGDWNCKVGFKRVDDRCEKVETVEHGKLLSDSGFYCESHYEKDEENRRCVPITLPENAEWDDASFDQWRCRQGYMKRDNRCEVFKLPEHAFWIGFNSWECDAGYMKVLDSGQWTTGRCEKVSIPEHAHPSQSWEKWDCDSGYVKNYRESRCEKQV